MYIKAKDGEPARLECTHFDYDGSAGPGRDKIKVRPCPSKVVAEGQTTARELRMLAHMKGWQKHPQMGDRCPKHLIARRRNLGWRSGY